MLKRTVVLLIIISMFIAAPAFAKKGASGGCKEKDVTGSYTRLIDGTFVDGYGNVVPRTYVRQLNINTGGTVNQDQSSGFDGAINFGIAMQALGSWACRDDGKLMVTVRTSNFEALLPDAIFPGSFPDVGLVANLKISYLFEIVDKNTLKLQQAVGRFYDMTEDPTDPLAGTLGPVGFGEFFYSRLEASDADLTP